MLNTVAVTYDENPSKFNEPAGVMRVSIFNVDNPSLPLATADAALGDAAVNLEVADVAPNVQTRLFAIVQVLGQRTGNVLHQIRTGDKVVDGPIVFEFRVPASAALM